MEHYEHNREKNTTPRIFVEEFCVLGIMCLSSCCVNCKKVKISLDRPGGSKRLRLPGILDNQHMKVARFSALCTSHLYYPRRYPLALISVRSRFDPRTTVQL
jgi:hypothetical protein